MPLVLPIGAKITDANNNPISGGSVRVYTAGMTGPGALVNLYSDDGLSSAITNPVVTDSAGYPSNGGNEVAINVALGTYDVAFLDASGSVIASWDGFVPTATDAADILRTLSSNARILITGSGGDVLIQAGKPSPTNTGGDLTLEGWAGTQLDALTLDSAETSITGNVDIDGDLTVGGEPIPAIVTSGVMSAASELVIPLTGGFLSYTLELVGIAVSMAGNLRITVSIDGGSTYVAGGNYDSYSVAFDATANAAAAIGYWMGTVGNLSTTAAKMQSLAIDLDTPLSGTGDTAMVGRAAISDVGYRTWGAVSAGGRVTHVKFAATAGTFTCTWRVRNRG